VVQGERLVTWTSASTVRGELAVTWTSVHPVQGTRQLTWSSARVVQGARPITWTSRPTVVRGTRTVTWEGSRPVQGRRTVTWNVPDAWPVRVRQGQRARVPSIRSNAGQVVSAQYSHTGTRESLNLTVLGRVTPQVQLSLTVSDAGSVSVVLDGDLFQYEPRRTPTGWVTTLHGYNKAASRLGSVRLDELIPWQLSPTPLPDRRVPCAARLKPQSTSVSGIVTEAFKSAGMLLSFPARDPFTGLTFEEGTREYSTLNKTPDQVFADTYGQIGWAYVVRGQIAAALPAGGGYLSGTVRVDDLADLSQRFEAANTPSLVTATGADLLMDKPDLIQLVSSAPDPASLQRELLQEAEWFVTTATDTGETIKGFRKSLGVIVATAELTRSDVTVQETVDGQLKTRTFSRVVTGFTSTETTYDPSCTDAVIRQTTIKQSFSYTLNTDTHSRVLSGPGFIGGYEVGTPLGDETQTVFQTYSPEGYLASRTTNTQKLVSVKQENADAAPKDRGEITPNEYLDTVLSETFQPTGGGDWLRLWNLSGAQQVPLYDAESGDAVRLSTKGGAVNGGQETLDSAPPQVRCPDPCAGRKAAYPQVARRSVPDGREGQEVSRSLPFVESGQLLDSFAAGIAESLSPTVGTDATLASVQDWRPGTTLGGELDGVVESYTLDAAAGMATVKLTARKLNPTGSEALTGETGPGPYRDLVTWRLPGGVVVNHFKGVKDNVPQFDRVFVRVTGANLPNPGDELEWRRDLRFGPTATGNYGN